MPATFTIKYDPVSRDATHEIRTNTHVLFWPGRKDGVVAPWGGKKERWKDKASAKEVWVQELDEEGGSVGKRKK